MKSGLLALLALPAFAATPPASPPAAPAGAAADPLDALVADSPFGAPTGGGRSAEAGPTGPLELRSIVFVDGAYQFSVYDQGTKKSEWIKIGEKGFPFVARSFNRERDALTVEHQGRTLVLALQAAKTGNPAATAAPSGPAPLPARNGATPPGGNQPNAANAGAPANPAPANATATAAPPPGSSNAAEAQRLQNLADEIRRRRGTGPQLVLPKKNQP